jgi:hypothetical protein
MPMDQKLVSVFRRFSQYAVVVCVLGFLNLPRISPRRDGLRHNRQFRESASGPESHPVGRSSLRDTKGTMHWPSPNRTDFGCPDGAPPASRAQECSSSKRQTSV